MKAVKPNNAMQTDQSDEIYWKQQVDACNASGMNKSKYCRHNQINYDRLMYWQKKLKNKTSTPFVPVKIKKEPMTQIDQPICTLMLSSGHVLKIHDEKALSLILDKWR
jgi:hypothetical protein